MTKFKHMAAKAGRVIVGLCVVIVALATFPGEAKSAPAVAQPNYIVDGIFRFPLDSYSVVQSFGNFANGGYHLAEDVSAVAGTPVYAAGNGIVKLLYTGTNCGNYGHAVVIEHQLLTGDPYGSYVVTIYGHLRGDFQVGLGDVQRGQLIGYVAPNGPDNGCWEPHLHFGVRKGAYDGVIKGIGTQADLANYWPPTNFINAHNGGSSCSTVSGQVILYDNTNCGGASIALTSAALWDISSAFNDRAESIAIPNGWSARLYKDNSTSSPSVCIPGTTTNLGNYNYSDGTSAANSATWVYVYNQSNCPGGNPPSQPANPNPSDSATLERNSNTTLSWNTDGTSCNVHIWGGSIDINPSGGCASLFLGQQYGGSYQWQVTASNNNGSTQGPAWRFYIKPYEPTSVNASTVSQTQINLSWAKSADDPGNIDSYAIYYSNGTLINTVGAGSTSYSIGGLTCGASYAFYVRSLRQGVESNASNQANAATAACGQAPTTPSNPNPSDGTTLERASNTTLYWNTNGTACSVHVWGGNIDITPSGGCANLFLGNQYGGSYQWQVTASNSNGSTQGPIWRFYIKPYPPTSLNASASSSTAINLSWTKPTDDPGAVDNYTVYYSNGALITTLNAGASSYTVGGLTCNTAYSFYVKAVRQGVESNASNTASTSTNGCAPAAPSNMRITGATAATLTFAWDDNSNNETGFKIYKWNGTTFVYLTSVSQNITSYTDSGLTCATSYFYEVSAYNASGESAHAPWIQGTTSACAQLPAAPTNLRMTSATQTSITLAWNDNSTNETGFKIYRWNGATYAYLASVGANVTTYTDIALVCGTGYVYYVVAYNNTGESGYAGPIAPGTQACVQAPTAPSNLRATGTTQNSVSLAWNDNANNEDGFRVYLWEASGVTYYYVAANATTYTYGSLNCGTAYPFSVTAYNSAGESAFSNQITVTTQACPNVSVTSVWTADGNGVAKTTFNRGDSIRYNGQVYNSASVSQTAYYNWAVNGICGSIASYSGNLTTQPGSSGWYLPTGIPNDACVGIYTYQLSVSHNGVTTTKATTFTVEQPCFTLTTSVAPTGSGSVSKNPAPNCNNGTQYAAGTVVTLTASAGSGYVFGNWSGSASGTANPSVVTMNSDKNIVANFVALPTCYTLTQNANPSSGGTVDASPAPNCNGGTQYTAGTIVTLTATTNPGYTFNGWSGDVNSSTNPVTLTMNSNRNAQANFIAVPTCYTLTKAISPSGSGVVNISPAPNCNNGTQYTSGMVITLTATANAGYGFGGWSGDVGGSTNPVTLTMNGNRYVQANFSATPTCYTLTKAVNPNGGGAVTANPAPNCNGGAQYTAGTVVELTANASTGYSFGSWSGDASGATNPTSVTMNGNKSVTANFSANTTFDDFNTPRVISVLRYTDNTDTTGMTSANDDPTLCTGNKGKATVWYRFIANANGTLLISTSGSNYDTVVAMWTGSRGNLTRVGCNDDANGYRTSLLVAPVVAGGTYYIEVAEYGSNTSSSLIKPESIANGGQLNLRVDFLGRATFLPLIIR